MCGLGVKADMLRNSQSNDILQHQDSNCGGTNNKHSLEEDEGSDFITKSRSLMSPAYCAQESREEIPRREARIDPPDGQQDSECNRSKEKTLGNDLCSVLGRFHVLLFLLLFSAAQVVMSVASVEVDAELILSRLQWGQCAHLLHFVQESDIAEEDVLCKQE